MKLRWGICMKVAIIGAGTSGLACAIELERNGIMPAIFERNDFIGEYNSHVSAFLKLISRPVPDPLKYIEKYFGIKINPLNPLSKVIHFSPNNQVDVTGSLGYFFIRGREENSFKNQLHKIVKSKVHFNTFVQPEEIERDFDYVVVADGHWSVPSRFGIWQEVMHTWVKGGVFEGDFEAETLQVWFDNKLTNGAYIYLAPYSKSRAVIAQIVQGIEQQEINNYWQSFLSQHNILKKYNLIETWELPHHAGLVTTNKVRNIYFIGAAGGGAEPFLGFGQFNAVYQGVMAARSISHGYDMKHLLKDLNKKSIELTTLRTLLNAATNENYDLLLTIMKLPGYRSLLYNTNINIIKFLATLTKPYAKNKLSALRNMGG